MLTPSHFIWLELVENRFSISFAFSFSMFNSRFNFLQKYIEPAQKGKNLNRFYFLPALLWSTCFWIKIRNGNKDGKEILPWLSADKSIFLFCRSFDFFFWRFIVAEISWHSNIHKKKDFISYIAYGIGVSVTNTKYLGIWVFSALFLIL